MRKIKNENNLRVVLLVISLLFVFHILALRKYFNIQIDESFRNNDYAILSNDKDFTRELDFYDNIEKYVEVIKIDKTDNELIKRNNTLENNIEWEDIEISKDNIFGYYKEGYSLEDDEAILLLNKDRNYENISFKDLENKYIEIKYNSTIYKFKIKDIRISSNPGIIINELKDKENYTYKVKFKSKKDEEEIEKDLSKKLSNLKIKNVTKDESKNIIYARNVVNSLSVLNIISIFVIFVSYIFMVYFDIKKKKIKKK